MWLFTNTGFYSIVQKEGTDFLTVRTRVAADLDALREKYMPELSATLSTAGTDYPYRATIAHADFSRGLAQIGGDLHYASFKEEISQSLSEGRNAVYTEIWCHLHQLEGENRLDRPARAPAQFGKKPAYGGVVLDCNGKVLLREPFSHLGGYVWTFPKDNPQIRETPEEAALRAVFERTGLRARIIDQIPGIYPGELTNSTYFLMSAEEQIGKFGQGSKSVKWMTREEAEAHIKMSSSVVGKARDLEVLNHAYAVFAQHFSQVTQTEKDIEEIEAAILNCAALRFDGYSYMDKTAFDSHAALNAYLETGELPVSPLDKLCVFFSLQRSLMKWSNSKKGRASKHWKAFRELFLITNQYCIPFEYRYEECWQRWKAEFLPKQAECVALVQVIHRTTQYEN